VRLSRDINGETGRSGEWEPRRTLRDPIPGSTLGNLILKNPEEDQNLEVTIVSSVATRGQIEIEAEETTMAGE
jgi:hypothetical protein